MFLFKITTTFILSIHLFIHPLIHSITNFLIHSFRPSESQSVSQSVVKCLSQSVSQSVDCVPCPFPSQCRGNPKTGQVAIFQVDSVPCPFPSQCRGYPKTYHIRRGWRYVSIPKVVPGEPKNIPYSMRNCERRSLSIPRLIQY